jgi:hypothetical protein
LFHNKWQLWLMNKHLPKPISINDHPSLSNIIQMY